MLSLIEFKQALGTVVAGMSKDDLRLLADHFDINGTCWWTSGCVAARQACRADGSFTAPCLRVLRVRSSGDGYISYREFLAMVDPTYA